MPDDRQAIIDELDRRGEFKDASKREAVQELARRGEIRLPKSLTAKGDRTAPLSARRPVSPSPPQSKSPSAPIDNTSKEKVPTLAEQAHEIIEGNITANNEQERQHQRGLLAPYHAVADPLSQLLSLGARGATEAIGRIHIPGITKPPAERGRSALSPLQQEINRQLAHAPLARRMAAEDPRGFGHAVSPDTSRRVEAMPSTGVQGVGKGVGNTALGLATLDNAVLAAALGAPGLAKGAAEMLGKAASGYFGVEAAKQATEKITEWNNSGRKNTAALTEGALSAVMAATAGHHAAGHPLIKRAIPAIAKQVAERTERAHALQTKAQAAYMAAEDHLTQQAKKLVTAADAEGAKTTAEPIKPSKEQQAEIDRRAAARRPSTPPKPAEKATQRPAGETKAKTRPVVPPAPKKPTEQNVAPPAKPSVKEYMAEVKAAQKKASETKPETFTVTPANDTLLGKNDAGEEVYRRDNKDGHGEIYRMRRDRKDRPNGYPDFGGDLAVMDAEKIAFRAKENEALAKKKTEGAKANDNTAAEAEPVAVPKTRTPERAKATAAKKPEAKVIAPEQFHEWVKSQPQGKIRTTAADLYKAYKSDHPATTEAQFGQMIHDLPRSEWEILTSPSGRTKFTATDSTGTPRQITGVRAKAKPKADNPVLLDIDREIAAHKEQLTRPDLTPATRTRRENQLRIANRERQAIIAPDLESTRYDVGKDSYSVSPEQRQAIEEAAKIATEKTATANRLRKGNISAQIQDIQAERDQRIQAILDKAVPYDAAFERRTAPEKAKPPPATLTPRSPVILTAAEASTAGFYLPDDHPLVPDLMNPANKGKVTLTPEQAEEVRGLLDKTRLDKSQTPTLFPDVPRKGVTPKTAPAEAPAPAKKPRESMEQKIANLEKATVEEKNGRFYVKQPEGYLLNSKGKPLPHLTKRLAELSIENRLGQLRKDAQVANKGPQELHAGIPLDKALGAVVGRERGQAWAESIEKFGASLRGLVNPTGVGNGSEVETRAGRDYFAQEAHVADQREQAFKPLRATFDRLPAGRGVKFMFDIERDNVHGDPKSQAVGDLLRDALDKKREQVNAQTGKLDAYFEHYFPHEWKSPSKATQFFGEGRRPFEGSKKFLRKRTIPTIEEGMFPKGAPTGLESMNERQIREEIDKQGGLQPLTLNPVELAQLKLQSMDRYLYAQKWFAEMKQQKRAVYLPIGKPMPDGWAKIHDSISQVREIRETTKADGSPGAPEIIERGSWIVPEGAARIVNNHLSPGFSGHETFGNVYRVMAATNNAMNMAQLGLSGFHATTMAMESLVSENARALSKATQGKGIQAGQAALWSHTGTAPLRDYYRGSKILQEYRTPGSVGGNVPEIVKSLVKGGGRVTLAKEFRLDAMESFGKALRKRDVPGMALSALPATLEGSMAWLMRDTVPKMKLGAFAELLEDEMSVATKGGRTLTEDQYREIASRVWDSIENRFGQLNYDNLFWDKAFKEAGHLAVRSLGWNLGTIREIGGGIADLASTRKRIAPHPSDLKELPAGYKGRLLTPRMAYVLSLAYTTALAGAVYSYLHGHKPETLEDYYHPKNHQGQRITLPGYGKDVQHYAQDPLGTIYGKKSPLVDVTLETLQNKDFFGKPLRNTDDPAVQQAQDYMRYLAKQVIPFSVRPKKGDSVGETIKKAVTTEEGREQAMGIAPYHPKKGTPLQRSGGRSILPRAATPRLPRLSVPRIQ